MAGGILTMCCCGGGTVEPGPCLNPCAVHSVAITIAGLVACPDIVNCSSGNGFCPFPTPYTPSNSQLMGTPPNGTYIGRPCPLPASGCLFSADFGQPFTPPTGSCPCTTPHTVNPPITTVCGPNAVLTASFVSVAIDTLGPGGTIRILPQGCQTIVQGGRICTVCCSPFGNPQSVTTTEDIAYTWNLPNGATGVTPQQFCDGMAASVSGTLGGVCRPCGFAGPGTWGTNHQSTSLITVTLARIN